MDRGYSNLLTVLRHNTTSLSPETLQASLAHYLAHASPSPSPLAGNVVSSPLFFPLDHARLQLLSTAFRHSSHIKCKALLATEDVRRSEPLGLNLFSRVFTRSIKAKLGRWAQDILKGIQGGHPVLRLACSCGMLLGMEDLRVQFYDGEPNSSPFDFHGARSNKDIENEVVVALAEIMDEFAYLGGDAEWEREFRKTTENEEVDTLPLSLILAAQCIPLVSSKRLKALPLQALSSLLTSTINKTFHSGEYLASASPSSAIFAEGQISPSPAILYSITESPLFTNIGPLSKLTARVLAILLDGRPADGLNAADENLAMLERLCARVEADWKNSALASVDENSIAPESRNIHQSVWTIYKTILFTTVMITNVVLRELVYMPPSGYSVSYIPLAAATRPSRNNTKPISPINVEPPALALATLRSLFHLAFVVSQFGGVISTQTGGFQEMKETFYLALDILSDHAFGHYAELWVQEVCSEMQACQRTPVSITGIEAPQTAPLKRRTANLPNGHENSKVAFALACAEQLIPFLNEQTVCRHILPVCLPNLNDPSHRETFESAHSVILAIFASHAQRAVENPPRCLAPPTAPTSPAVVNPSQSFPLNPHDPPHPNSTQLTEISHQPRPDPNAAVDVTNWQSLGLTARLVPFYTKCLIENSKHGRLSTAQLRLAYSALVRSACVHINGSNVPTSTGDRYALAMFCIQSLLDAIREVAQAHTQPSDDRERLHRLHLALISSVPSLPLSLLPCVLGEIHSILLRSPQPNEAEHRYKNELVQALFTEVHEGIGDREKAFVMRWWYDVRQHLKDVDNRDADDEISHPTNALLSHL